MCIEQRPKNQEMIEQCGDRLIMLKLSHKQPQRRLIIVGELEDGIDRGLLTNEGRVQLQESSKDTVRSTDKRIIRLVTEAIRLYKYRSTPFKRSLLYSANVETGLISTPYFSLSLCRLRSSYPGGSMPKYMGQPSSMGT
jgi:hypothetical protein